MKRFQKVYLEISNICNLSCAFCPGTKRTPKVMTQAELDILLPKLRPWTDYLYFHLMGEPLCHPQLEIFLQAAKDHGFKVILTTNGTLLETQKNMLLASPALHKVNISLHAFEANDLSVPFETYLQQCFAFGKAAENHKLVVFRLWNQGGAEEKNAEILREMQRHFPKPWVQERKGIRIGNRVYLEYGDKFDWPDLNVEELGDSCFCYGLRDQIGVLCDGTVVPCCLDSEGVIQLGNIFSEDIKDILHSQRAVNMVEGFKRGVASEDLCKKCGYAQRFV